MRPLKLLFVDDDPTFRKPLALGLRHAYKWEVNEFDDLASALRNVLRGKDVYDVALVDIIFPDVGDNGVTFLDELRRRQIDLPVVFITGQASTDTAISAIRGGAADYITKPLTDRSEAAEAILRARALHQMKRQLKALADAAALPNANDGIHAIAKHALECTLAGIGGRNKRLFWLHLDQSEKICEIKNSAGHEKSKDISVIKRRLKTGALRKDARQAVEERRAVTRDDAPGSRKRAKGRALASWIVVPILVQDEPVAALLVTDSEPDGFGDSEQRFLTAVARVAGIQIDRTQQWFARLEAERGQAAAKAELEAIRIIPTGMAHHMRHPLTVIKGRALQLLEARSSKPEETGEKLKAINRSADRIEFMLEHLRVLSNMPRLDPRKTDVTGVVKFAVARAKQEAKAMHISSNVKITARKPRGPVHVIADQVELKLAVAAIVDNALETLADKITRRRTFTGKIQISLRTDKSKNCVVIAVQDNGVGMTPEEKSRAFDPLYSSKPDAPGLGLTMARMVMGSHGGRIEIADGSGRGKEKGTTVRLYLPLNGPHAGKQQHDPAGTKSQ